MILHNYINRNSHDSQNDHAFAEFNRHPNFFHNKVLIDVMSHL